MAEELIAKLRTENASLISELKKGVNKLQKYVDGEKNKAFSDLRIQRNEQTDRTTARNRLDFRPKSSKKKSNHIPTPSFDSTGDNCQTFSTSRKNVVTSTPMGQKSTLEAEGNMRRKCSRVKCTPTKRNLGNKDTTMKENRPKSILRTPDARKSPKLQKAKVCFPSNCTETKIYSRDDSKRVPDSSFLGYDWIAGMIDNESESLTENDDFFNEIKEFRRVNMEECVSRKLATSSSTPRGMPTPNKVADHSNRMESCYHNEVADFCSGSTYTVDNRLLPVPIHGPYSQCPVCQSKPEPETEYTESYVRVSVPRSSLKSPYRIKPHRRKSFDPSDTVALSEHCLAGWQCARPSYAPGPDVLDLRTSSKYQSKMLSTASGNQMTSYQRTTEDILSSTIKLRHGLQLLEGRENRQRRANTTAYPAF